MSTPDEEERTGCSDDETDLYMDACSTVPFSMRRHLQGQGENTGTDLQNSSNGLVYDVVAPLPSLYDISKPKSESLDCPLNITTDPDIFVYDLAKPSDCAVYELAKNMIRTPSDEKEPPLPELRIVEATQHRPCGLHFSELESDDQVSSSIVCRRKESTGGPGQSRRLVASGVYHEVVYPGLGRTERSARGKMRTKGTALLRDDEDVDGDGDFSDSESEEEPVVNKYATKPLPTPPKSRGSFIWRLITNTFDGKASKEDSSSDLLRIHMDINKHPPPALPDAPANLTPLQAKKRKVVESIINSERSYIESLERIITVYMYPLLKTYGLEHKELKLKDVFNKTQKILDLHLMFQLVLADSAKNWDKSEEIGIIFTSLISQAMVVGMYSQYINNFSTAMEEIKQAQSTKPAFKTFLQEQERITSDRLSLFGLMVKPVQRFPQFIMFMQELLKYTPQNHHDRCGLQRALTELDNVAHRLNESKRENEQYLEAKKLLRKLGKTIPDSSQKLLRKDDFEQMTKASSTGEIQLSWRRLILMDDCLIVTKVIDGDKEENLRVRNHCALVNMELKDSSISPSNESVVARSSRHPSVQSNISLKAEDDPFHLHNDLNKMMHDLSVLGKLRSLVSTLQRSYEGLSEDVVIEIMRDLQQMIQVKDQQLQLLSSCTINMHDTLRNIGYTFQTSIPELKQEWCQDFLLAKFALEPQNNPAWMKVEETNCRQSVVFMKTICADIPRNYTKMKCAVPVFLSAPGSIDIGMPHLWVVMTTEKRTQVALVSTQSTKPALVESFQAMDVEVVAVETVQGYATVDTKDAFVEDTVWMSTVTSEIAVFQLFNESGRRDISTMTRKPRARFYCPGVAMVMRAVDDQMFVGCSNGKLVIYDRNEEGKWHFATPVIVNIDNMPIRCILTMDEEVWLSCRDCVYIVRYQETKYSEKIKMCSNKGDSEISEMVHAGVGLWVSYKDQSLVCLFHIETKENLQEVNIKGTVERMFSNCPMYTAAKLTDSSCVVTSLMASRGYLWIGTELGVTLTISIPRLKDGVPLYWDTPWVSCHAHNGPVRFHIPVYCDTVNLSQFVEGAIQMQGNESWESVDQISDIRKSSSSGDAESETLEESIRVKVLPTNPDEVFPAPSASYMNFRSDDKNRTTNPSPARILRHPANTLPFRQELNQTIGQKRVSTVKPTSLLDSVSGKEEVSLYYSDLMFFDDGSDSSKSSDTSDKISRKESIEREGPPEAQNKDVKLDKKNNSIGKRSSMSHKLPGENIGPRKKTNSMQSKRICNAVIVISGGDGYLDWKRPSADQKEHYRNDEASLIMWMYKF